MKRSIYILALALCACATAPSPRELEIRRQIAQTIPICSSDNECAVKWTAARNWVLQNAGWKLQHIQPDFLETYNAVNSSTNIAVRVVKEALPGGKHRMVATVWCDNMFGCIPNQLDALLSFNNYVNASWQP